mmetsp:Transcript_4761/g.7198  ORF Transcript_4761/g.7198 Transcript_4761/m.7198 type:complete len:285 (+) Transcript_4761:14-868(+)
MTKKVIASLVISLLISHAFIPPKTITCPRSLLMSSSLPFDPLSPSNSDECSEFLKQAGTPEMVGTRGSRASRYRGVPIGPPPDLPSLLLHNRIVYLGMPLVPAVTELIIAELLYLNYESATKPIFMYINTPGTTTADGRSVGFETEAFAIADCMKYVKPPVHTIAVGQAFGTGAMLLSQGQKGNRSALPNASIMLHQPRSQTRGQASDMAIKAREVIANRRVTCSMISQACGKAYDVVEKDSSRTFYMSPDEAVEYGLIDKVLAGKTKNVSAPKPKFLDSIGLS